MLGELQALRLIVRTDALAVQFLRPCKHFLVDQTADNLSMLKNERHLSRTHFKNGARTLAASPDIPKTWIEEARIVHAEFAHERVVWHHLRRIIRRHLHRFLGGKNIELVGIEDQGLVGTGVHRLPEIGDGVSATPLDIDESCVTLGPIADETAWTQAGKVHADSYSFAHVGLVGIDQTLARMQFAQGAGVEQRVTAAKADLRQP